jgi:hypothetical protein
MNLFSNMYLLPGVSVSSLQQALAYGDPGPDSSRALAIHGPWSFYRQTKVRILTPTPATQRIFGGATQPKPNSGRSSAFSMPIYCLALNQSRSLPIAPVNSFRSSSTCTSVRSFLCFRTRYLRFVMGKTRRFDLVDLTSRLRAESPE